MIKAVIFDCFGVLYADPGLLFYEANVPNYVALRPEMMQIDKQCDLGLITQNEHNHAIAELTGLDFDIVKDGVQGTHSRNDTLLAFSQQLRPSYKVGMLSNIGRGSMESFFSHSECLELFDSHVLSSEVGMVKPTVEIFQYMAMQLGLEPAECVMIDDRQDNCDGAASAGMEAILHGDTQSTIEAVFRIIENGRA